MRRAFTLIELMIVVAIIGILASIAVPNFIKFQCRSKQSEVKTGLKNIIVAEEAFRGENDRYVLGTEAQLSVISFAIVGTTRRYDFDVPTADQTAFRAVGTANNGRGSDLRGPGGERDTWESNQTGRVAPIINVCQ